MNFGQISKFPNVVTEAKIQNLILKLEVMTQLEIPQGNETFGYKVKSGVRFDGFKAGSREGIV